MQFFIWRQNLITIQGGSTMSYYDCIHGQSVVNREYSRCHKYHDWLRIPTNNHVYTYDTILNATVKVMPTCHHVLPRMFHLFKIFVALPWRLPHFHGSSRIIKYTPNVSSVVLRITTICHVLINRGES